MTRPFYADWTQAQVLALVLKGIRNGKVPDQTIMDTDTSKAELEMAPLSEIISHSISQPSKRMRRS